MRKKCRKMKEEQTKENEVNKADKNETPKKVLV
jgi:hypothetical protein